MKQWFDKYKKLIYTMLGLVVIILILCWLLYPSFMKMVNDPNGFRQTIENAGIFGYGIMIFIVIIQMVLAFLPGEPVEFIAGVCFGPWLGTLLCLFASVIGAAIIFILMRLFSEKLIYRFFDPTQVEQLSFLKKEERLELILFIVFFIPGTPKDLLTYFAPLTPIPLSKFLLITSIAKIPSIISSTIAGSAVLSQDYSIVIMVYVITAILSLIGIIGYNHYLAQHKAA